MTLSVVSPVYKGEKMVEMLVSRIVAAVSTLNDASLTANRSFDYEIILVNDC